MTKKMLNRLLPERSNLSFFFPNKDGDGYLRLKLPFFENIKVSESKKARIQTHSLVSRSSDLYTYLGADSRKLRLEFNITLPHILESLEDINQWKSVLAPVSETRGTSLDRNKFFSKTPNIAGGFIDVYRSMEEYYSSLSKTLGFNPPTLVFDSLANTPPKFNGFLDRVKTSGEDLWETIKEGIGTLFTNFTEKVPQEITLSHFEVRGISVFLYYLNLIRTSVINNAEDPTLGPPIIRLRHGTMYQNIPCICTDYSIQIDENAGYDLKTLTPRRVNVSMSLEEYRAGNFGKFKRNAVNILDSDNIAGWESVIYGNGSMDPQRPGLF